MAAPHFARAVKKDVSEAEKHELVLDFLGADPCGRNKRPGSLPQRQASKMVRQDRVDSSRLLFRAIRIAWVGCVADIAQPKTIWKFR